MKVRSNYKMSQSAIAARIKGGNASASKKVKKDRASTRVDRDLYKFAKERYGSVNNAIKALKESEVK